MLRFPELLNKVWGLEGCPLKGQTMGLNCPIIYLAAFAPAFDIADFIALVETNSST